MPGVKLRLWQLRLNLAPSPNLALSPNLVPSSHFSVIPLIRSLLHSLMPLPVQPIPPGPGQESVWDYPRPAIWQPTSQRIQVIYGGITLADTTQSKRVLETSHPPTYYIPPEDVNLAYLEATAHQTRCEWKGRCRYFDGVVGDRRLSQVAWQYIEPTVPFEPLLNHFAFYGAPINADPEGGCYVDGDRIIPQEGSFYGGWITPQVVGPFKGAPHTWGW